MSAGALGNRALGPVRVGAIPVDASSTQFAVWAPAQRRVHVHLLGEPDRVVELDPVGGGYHADVVDRCPPGTRYRYVLDDGNELADPASRLQPDGVHGPSEVVDLAAHHWEDAPYRPRPLWQQVISECHVGTSSAEGTFAAAVDVLDDLVEVGITAVEVMPVAQFPGSRNWGYDGVFPFAVQCTYGGPAGLQRLVDESHRRGLAVVLDVVHNHVGPEGDVLGSYGPYFTERYRTPWGPAMNFDGPGSDDVRSFFLQSAAQWFTDFHVDGLRLDAIHGIVDTSATPFLLDLSRLAADLRGALGRPCWLIAESADNDPRVVTAGDAGGLGMDAQWNDDFHHALHAVLTGERVGYYADFGSREDLARALSDGFVYQGEHSAYRGRRHGAASGALAPERFVHFAQNHDHIGNRPQGRRLATIVPPDRLRLAAAVLLLAPGIPLLFMGEEYGETAPFPYFVDHGDGGLLDAVRRGRAEDLRHLGFGEDPLDPAAASTGRAAVPDRSLRGSSSHRQTWELHQRLLTLRRTHPALARSPRAAASASVSGPVLTLLRRHPAGPAVALFNLGSEEATAVVPAHDGAAASGRPWQKLLDSAASDLGGTGAVLPDPRGEHASLTLAPWAFCAYGADGQLT